MGRQKSSKHRTGTNGNRRKQQSNNITHFALKELVVGSDELLSFRCFGNIFDTSQQFVLVQELHRERKWD